MAWATGIWRKMFMCCPRLTLFLMSFILMGTVCNSVAQPEVPLATSINPNLFYASDLKDAAALAWKLRQAEDPLTRYLIEGCSTQTKLLLNAYQKDTQPDDQLRGALVRDFNQLIQRESIYDPARFAKIKLSDDTRKLLNDETSPKEKTRLQLNRLLLEDAFPQELLRVSALPLEVQADSLEVEYPAPAELDALAPADQSPRLLVASGHVCIQQADEILRADHAVINMDTGDILADGNVTFERGSVMLRGKKMRYNHKSRRGDFGEFRGYFDPFYITSQTSYQEKDGEYVAEGVIFTPSEKDPPQVYMRARRARISPGRDIRAEHVVLYVNQTPIMYVPYWVQNIGKANFMSFVPGYSRRMYAYLLSTIHYRLTKKIEADNRVDVRLRRGVAVGQDVMWSAGGNTTKLSRERYLDEDKDEPWSFARKHSWANKDDDKEFREEDEDAWFGDVNLYYARDAWPNEGKKQKYSIPEDRYRMRLYHSQNFSPQDYFIGQVDYLSDAKFIEQYFREEYRSAPEPDNYLVWTHHTDRYTLSMEIEQRFNDFYTALSRTPVVTLDMAHQRIKESPFFYQGKTTAGYYNKEWENALSNRQDYAAFRFDTDNTVYYPRKFFGFLTTIPRAGYHGSFYSATKEDRYIVTKKKSKGSNNVPVTVTTTNIHMDRKEAQYRNLFEIGLENSLKAFKVWQTHPGDVINDLRHIVEPYTDYTFIPEPDVPATNLYQFDESDELGMQNNLKFGLRNKFQTRRDKVYDLFYLDVWTAYRFQKEGDQGTLSNLAFEVRSLPCDWAIFKIDASYDLDEQTFKTFNTRLNIKDRTFWSYQIEHRYKKDSSLFYNSLTVSPSLNWRFSGFVRYDFFDSTLEECGITVQRRYDCLTAKLGFGWQDDEYDVWLQFWFTDFPKARVDVGF